MKADLEEEMADAKAAIRLSKGSGVDVSKLNEKVFLARSVLNNNKEGSRVAVSEGGNSAVATRHGGEPSGVTGAVGGSTNIHSESRTFVKEPSDEQVASRRIRRWRREASRGRSRLQQEASYKGRMPWNGSISKRNAYYARK